MAEGSIRIARLTDIDTPAVRAAIEAIFWETVTTPPSPATRDAFRDLWLGQYLRHEPHLVVVAQDGHGSVSGYLVGCHDNPATSPRFTHLTFFSAFADACARYPAHLHINLTATCRGLGVGGRLISAFAETVRTADLPGLHVVTGADQRNVSFYTRAGFREIARTTNMRGSVVLFLGRDVA